MPFPSLMPAPEPEKNDSKQSGFPGILELTRNVIDSQGYNKASNIGLQGYVGLQGQPQEISIGNQRFVRKSNHSIDSLIEKAKQHSENIDNLTNKKVLENLLDAYVFLTDTNDKNKILNE